MQIPSLDPLLQVFELRRYLLSPGGADAFVELFDRALVESQEQHGLQVVGQFVELPGRDRFVWLRGFPDMQSRLAGLTAFYDGPVWAEHKQAANGLMLDSDDVLLLRPVITQPVPSAPGPWIVTVHHLAESAESAFLPYFLQHAEPTLVELGSALAAVLVTEASASTFPRLPVREGEHVLVRISRGEAEAGERLDAVLGELDQRAVAAATVLRLEPTPRSRLR